MINRATSIENLKAFAQTKLNVLIDGAIKCDTHKLSLFKEILIHQLLCNDENLGGGFETPLTLHATLKPLLNRYYQWCNQFNKLD